MSKQKPMKPTKAWAVVDDGRIANDCRYDLAVACDRYYAQGLSRGRAVVRVRILKDAAVERAISLLRQHAWFRHDAEPDVGLPNCTADCYGCKIAAAIRDLGGKV